MLRAAALDLRPDGLDVDMWSTLGDGADKGSHAVPRGCLVPYRRRESSITAWTHRVAINLARSRYRQLRVQLRYRYRLSQEQSAEHFEQEPLATLAFKDLVADLPPRQKSALVLRYFLCLSVREVAYVMDCSEGTAKSLIHKAIASLRRRAAKEAMEATSSREGVPNAIRS